MAVLKDVNIELDEVEAKDLLKKYKHLLSTPNVVSLSYCSEKKEGRKTGRNVLRVGVIKKLPAEDIKDPDVLLPKAVEYETLNKKVSVPVQVVEEGEICALSPPYEGGSKVHATGAVGWDTLGVNTYYKGKHRLLNAAHVLTRFDPANIGREINPQSHHLDPFQSMGITVEGQVDVELYDSPNVQNPVCAKQDLAWATITSQQGLPEIVSADPINDIRDPIKDELVQYYSASSQKLQSNIPVADTATMAKVRIKVGNSSYKYAYFEDICCLDISQACPMPGDSGSAMIAQSDKRIVGILFSGGLLSAYFCRLTF